MTKNSRGLIRPLSKSYREGVQMTGIERLVDIVTDGPYSGGMIHISVQKLREVCEQIERETDDISGYESDVLAFVEEKGGLTELERRLMPEGYEWPRYESGELVGFGDEYVNAKGNVSTLRTIVIKDCRDRLGGGYYWKLGKGACAVVVKNGERIKRPPVLAADGEPLEVGQTVYAPRYDYVRCTVLSFEWVVDGWLVEVENEGGNKFRQTPDCFTHQRPVLDADGVPIKVGDTVWLVDQSDSDWKFTVANVLAPNERSDGKWSVKIKSDWGVFTYRETSQITHAKPEPDSWSSVWADVSNGNETPEGMMRRCRALAERGE